MKSSKWWTRLNVSYIFPYTRFMIQRLGILISCLALGIALIGIDYSEIGQGIAILSFIMGLTVSLVYIFGGKYKITYEHWRGGVVKFEYPKWKRWLLLDYYPSLSQIEAKVAYRYGGKESQDYCAHDNIIWQDTGCSTICINRPCVKKLYFGFQEHRLRAYNLELRPFIGKGAILLEISLQTTGEKLASFNIEVLDFRFCVDEYEPFKYATSKRFTSDQ